MRFSIIVPIFNVQEYLEECMESLLNQTYTDYEIILIDDGSTDESGRIADKYANDKIHVIHQPNAGLSSARNTGIDNSKGEYIVFVDSDDYITVDALEKFNSIIEKNEDLEIIAAQAYSLDSEGKIEPELKNRRPIIGILDGRRFIETGYKQNSMVACAQLSIYKKMFIENNHLSFISGIRHEDELWTPNAYYASQKTTDGDFIFYFHREREGSITHSKNKTRNAKDLFFVCDRLVQLANQHGRNCTVWLRDHIAMLYMNAVFIGGKELLDSVTIDRMLPIRNAKTVKNKVKAVLFCISPKQYYFIDKLIKKRTQEKCR